MKRLFIAIKIEKNDTLVEVVNEFQKAEKYVNWVDINNLHITLEFLGDTEISRIPYIKKALDEACSGKKAFNFTLYSLGTFGNQNNPNVFWVGLKEYTELSKLQLDLHDKLAFLGITLETRSYKPHLTLGRIKQIENLSKLKILINNYRNNYFGIQSIDHIILYESILGPTGPVYKELHKAKLDS